VFTESLPPTWWLGAGLLVAGNVIIGRRDEEEKKDGAYQAVATDEGELRTREGSAESESDDDNDNNSENGGR